MGFNINATSSTVTVVGEITAQVDKKTVQPLIVSVTSNTTPTTLGTVPTGKVWRIVAAQIIINSGTSSTNYEANLLFNSVPFLQGAARGFATYGGNPVTANATWSYEAAPVLTAGQLVQYSTATATVYTTFLVWYVEEDA